jgi:hypothetical protein
VLRNALSFSVILLVYDVLAALVAKALTISYNSFLVLALVIVFFMGVYAGRTARSWEGIVAIAIAACVEATAGWYLAALIGPGYVPGWTPRVLVTMAVESALLSTAIGCLGVWTGLRVAAYFSSR